jgi:hypothetical protein
MNKCENVPSHPNMPDKQQWHTLDKVFAEVFSRQMPETDSEALRFILMEVQSLTRVGTKRTNELLTEILDELREIRSALSANLIICPRGENKDARL